MTNFSVKNKKGPGFNLNPVRKKIQQIDSSLSVLNNHIQPNYNDLVSNKAEYYKSMFPPFFEIFKNLHPFIKRVYFRNNHRIFIYWIVQLSRKYDPAAVFDTFNDLPYMSKKEQIEFIEEINNDYNCKTITSRKLKGFKRSQLKLINTKLNELRTNFVKDILKKKVPMQIEVPKNNSLILGSKRLEEVKKIVGSWVCNGYEVKEKYFTPIVSGSEDPSHVYFYVIQKNDQLGKISIN